MQFALGGLGFRHGRNPGGRERAGGARYLAVWSTETRGSVTSADAYATDIESDHWSATCWAALRSSVRIDSAMATVS